MYKFSFCNACGVPETALSSPPNLHNYAQCIRLGNKHNHQQKKCVKRRQMGQNCSKSIVQTPPAPVCSLSGIQCFYF